MKNNPDKLALKNKLYQDQLKLLEALNQEVDIAKKLVIQEKLDLVNSYILICNKRNKF